MRFCSKFGFSWENKRLPRFNCCLVLVRYLGIFSAAAGMLAAFTKKRYQVSKSYSKAINRIKLGIAIVGLQFGWIWRLMASILYSVLNVKIQWKKLYILQFNQVFALLLELVIDERDFLSSCTDTPTKKADDGRYWIFSQKMSLWMSLTRCDILL